MPTPPVPDLRRGGTSGGAVMLFVVFTSVATVISGVYAFNPGEDAYLHPAALAAFVASAMTLVFGTWGLVRRTQRLRRGRFDQWEALSVPSPRTELAIMADDHTAGGIPRYREFWPSTLTVVDGVAEVRADDSGTVLLCGPVTEVRVVAKRGLDGSIHDLLLEYGGSALKIWPEETSGKAVPNISFRRGKKAEDMKQRVELTLAGYQVPDHRTLYPTYGSKPYQS